MNPKAHKTVLYICATFVIAFLVFHLVRPNLPTACVTISFSDPHKYERVLTQMLREEYQLAVRGSESSLRATQKATQTQPTPQSTIANRQNLQGTEFVWNNSGPLYSEQNVIIFIITATYMRPTQLPDMTRLANTLRLVPNIFWIVVEDAAKKTKVIKELLVRTKVPYVHLLGPKQAVNSAGASNKLRAFDWIRENYRASDQKGVIYIADDDNSYDTRLFDEMRNTQLVSVFPVGGIATLGLSSPIVNMNTGKVIDFHDPFGKEVGRKYAMDMAGFAVNLQFFLSKNATMKHQNGWHEDSFLWSLGLEIDRFEPKAKNCTEILVWHTRTAPADWWKLENMRKVNNFKDTNLPALYVGVFEWS